MKRLFTKMFSWFQLTILGLNRLVKDYATPAVNIVNIIKECVNNPKLDVLVQLTDNKIDDTVLKILRSMTSKLEIVLPGNGKDNNYSKLKTLLKSLVKAKDITEDENFDLKEAKKVKTILKNLDLSEPEKSELKEIKDVSQLVETLRAMKKPMRHAIYFRLATMLVNDWMNQAKGKDYAKHMHVDSLVQLAYTAQKDGIRV